MSHGSNLDLFFCFVYAIMALRAFGFLFLFRAPFRLTTYLTIDRFGAYGNNGYKTVEEHFSRSINGYKKPFVAERAFLLLFGTQRSWVRIPSPRPSSPRPIGCKGIRTGS